nr:hypothetical protein [Tanacetum cinerariifolium]
MLQAPTEGYEDAIVVPVITADNFELKHGLRKPKIHNFDHSNHCPIQSKKDNCTNHWENDPAPTEGYGEAIVIPEILAENFEIKTNLLQLVQANKFRGFEKDNPHTHISNFKRMTATLKYRDVLNDAIELMLFPYLLEDTFYNGLTEQDQDSLNAAVGGNLLNKTTREALKIIENKSKIYNLVEIVNKQVIAPAKAVEKTCVTCGGAHAYYECIATDRSFFQNQPSTSSTLPSNTVPNPKGEMKAMTTRSDLAYEGPSIPTESPLEKVDERNTEEILDKEHSNSSGSTVQVQPPVVPISIPEPDVPRTQTKPTIPYPSSFADALLLMPKFASTIKSLLGNKDKLFELAKVPLNENCSAMLLKKLPEKLRDPGKFLIPCDFPRMEVCHALADLRASINLMPLSIWKKLSLPELTPTRMTLELADRSITRPKGVAKDVFVKVGKFHFPTDFVVVDFEADPRVPLILGRLVEFKSQEIKFYEKIRVVEFDLNNKNIKIERLTNELEQAKKEKEDLDSKLTGFQSASKDLDNLLENDTITDYSRPSPTIESNSDDLQNNNSSVTETGESSSTILSKPVIKFVKPADRPTEIKTNKVETVKKPAIQYAELYRKTSRNSKVEDPIFGNNIIDVYGEEITLRDVLDFQYNPKSSSPTLVFDASVSEKEPIVKSSSPTLTLGESDFFLEEIKDFLNDDSIPTRIENSVYDPEGDILFLEKLLNEDPFQLPPMDLKLAEESKEKSSVEEPPELELKELPSHLEYAFLEDSNKLPIIIAKNLKVDEREALINVLKSHKRAIAWKIFDIKVQSQRRVNPKIHDVIKKEVIKLLDASMIYPISDSPWVSPIHCVPKKGGITVVANENNELIPTRLVSDWRRYMMSIFHDMIEKTMEVFMDEFLIFRDSFLSCLTNLDKMLNHCEETNLVLNWEKCHFMCREGIVLGYKILKSGIEVDRAKVDVIAKLPHPTTVKGVRSFLGHAGFYRRFIQDFSKISRPMTHLLEKETPFVFSKESIGAVLGQCKSKHFQPIHYASKMMTGAQIHYTTTEKEMLAVVYAFEKFQPYLVLSKSIVYTDHSALKYLLNKQYAKPRLLRWVLFLQEFDITILDKKGSENLAADHLSRLENPHQDVLENKDINENFPLETLGSLTSHSTPWFVDIVNFHLGNFIKKGLTSQQKKKFFKDLLTSSKLAMGDLLGAIMVPISQRRRGREKYLREMRCLRTVSKFMRYSIFRFTISDRGTHFCNDQFTKVMIKYGVTHWLATSYHPQTSGQVEVSNRGLKRILKRTVGENRASWSDKLDDALWAFHTAYKTPIGCIPYKLVYGKSCHLPIELEHTAYWALKHVNFDLKTTGDHRKLQLNELSELHDQAYENSIIYKDRTKKLHDSKIKNRIFNVDDQVLLFNSRLKIFSGKLKTRWSGPFTITRAFSYGTIELSQFQGFTPQ